MLPRLNRFALRKNPQFFLLAKKISTRSFAIYYCPQPLESIQAVVIAAKKNFPTAVARNAVKRQASEVLSPILSLGKHLAIVVVMYQPLKNVEQRQMLKRNIESILKVGA